MYIPIGSARAYVLLSKKLGLRHNGGLLPPGPPAARPGYFLKHFSLATRVARAEPNFSVIRVYPTPKKQRHCVRSGRNNNAAPDYFGLLNLKRFHRSGDTLLDLPKKRKSGSVPSRTPKPLFLKIVRTRLRCQSSIG